MNWRLRRSATIALILSPVGILLVSAARLLIVSDYNVTTAVGILESGGYVNTLLGALIPLLPILMPYIALTFLFFKRIILAVLAMAAAVFVSPASTSAGGLPGVWKWYVSQLDSWGMREHAWANVFLVLGVILALALAVLLLVGEFTVVFRVLGTILSIALIPAVLRFYPLPVNGSYYQNQIEQPWLPAEKVTFADHRTLVIYKLSSDGVFIEALVADNRTIRFLHETDVAAQQVCETSTAALGQPLIALFHRPAVVPPCGPSSSVPSGPPGAGIARVTFSGSELRGFVEPG
jgi:hypothetical protein